MQLRRYGRSDVRVSEVGLGGHREGVDVKPGLARTARYRDSLKTFNSRFDATGLASRLFGMR